MFRAFGNDAPWLPPKGVASGMSDVEETPVMTLDILFGLRMPCGPPRRAQEMAVERDVLSSLLKLPAPDFGLSGR